MKLELNLEKNKKGEKSPPKQTYKSPKKQPDLRENYEAEKSKKRQKVVANIASDAETVAPKAVPVEKENKHTVVRVILIFFISLVVIYLAGFFFYKFHFFPGSYINGNKYSNQTVTNVSQALASKGNNVELTLIDESETETINTSDFDYYEITDGDISSEVSPLIKNQNTALWFLNIFDKKEYDVQKSQQYSETALQTTVNNLKSVSRTNSVAPKSATFERQGDEFLLVPEVLGNTVNVEKLETAILHALNNNQTQIDFRADGVYDQPLVTTESETVTQAQSTLKKLKDTTITYTIDQETETLNYSKFIDWITFDEQDNVAIDEQQAQTYIKSLSSKYDTLGSDRTFASTLKGDIVIGGGTYGWMTNTKATTTALCEQLQKAESANMELSYKQPAQTRNGINGDIGNTYIEVDLNAQHMWFYVDGTLFIETDIVSGLPDGQNDTPQGVFVVWSRERDRYLTGQDYQSWVNYWMPIDYTGVGIHDSSWQTAYGGEIYKTKGSHGCINTPRDICDQIYNKVTVGTPVIVHG